MRKLLKQTVCLRGASEKIVYRDYPCYTRFGGITKKLSAQSVVYGKQFECAELMVEKFPGEKIMVRPSYK